MTGVESRSVKFSDVSGSYAVTEVFLKTSSRFGSMTGVEARSVKFSDVSGSYAVTEVFQRLLLLCSIVRKRRLEARPLLVVMRLREPLHSCSEARRWIPREA